MNESINQSINQSVMLVQCV